MIGSGKLDIDGETATGTIEPLMRQGEWYSGGQHPLLPTQNPAILCWRLPSIAIYVYVVILGYLFISCRCCWMMFAPC